MCYILTQNTKGEQKLAKELNQKSAKTNKQTNKQKTKILIMLPLTNVWSTGLTGISNLSVRKGPQQA